LKYAKFKKGNLKRNFFSEKKAGLTQTPETQHHKFQPKTRNPKSRSQRMSSTLNPTDFRLITESEAEYTMHDREADLDPSANVVSDVRSSDTSSPQSRKRRRDPDEDQHLFPTFPKIQFWNDYPGRATLRSQNREIYMLGVHGPLGPLGIADEKGSYSLSRKLIGPVEKPINLFRHSLEHGGNSFMRMRETLILTELKDGKVTTWEVAEHKAGDNLDYFDPRSDHRILLTEGKSPTYLKDQEGKIVEDAEIVVAANWYVLTLTRSGDLYFNQHLYMKDIQSIARATKDEFILILNENHTREFHRNTSLRTYLRDQDARNGKDDMKKLKPYGRNFGDRDSSLPVVGPSVYLKNNLGYIGLRTDGRLSIQNRYIEELESVLADRSNYVKSVAASSYFFAALLELGDGNQQVHIWSDGDNVVVDFEMHSCFKKKKPEDGTVVRKRIVDITVSDDSRSMTSQYYGYSGPSKSVHPQEAIAFNFEDNSSCLLSFSRDGAELSFLASFPSEHTQSIHNTADGMLVVTDSQILKMTEPGQPLDILIDSKRRRYVSFVASPDGYVIVYPDGEFIASESVQPPTKIKNTIRQGGGIAEIYHDKSGTFHAILRNGALVSWYNEAAGFVVQQSLGGF
jgi:hypothetical protein